MNERDKKNLLKSNQVEYVYVVRITHAINNRLIIAINRILYFLYIIFSHIKYISLSFCGQTYSRTIFKIYIVVGVDQFL